ncbi:hypothetical protein KCP75_04595 [Salmonella enterica subsp. enterica]|nr:hypothetical protein KCP75_04595 [Salmonella enterica subsp. enterica]
MSLVARDHCKQMLMNWWGNERCWKNVLWQHHGNLISAPVWTLMRCWRRWRRPAGLAHSTKGKSTC